MTSARIGSAATACDASCLCVLAFASFSFHFSISTALRAWSLDASDAASLSPAVAKLLPSPPRAESGLGTIPARARKRMMRITPAIAPRTAYTLSFRAKNRLPSRPSHSFNAGGDFDLRAESSRCTVLRGLDPIGPLCDEVGEAFDRAANGEDIGAWRGRVEEKRAEQQSSSRIAQGAPMN